MTESNKKARRVNVYEEPYDVCIMRPGIYGNPYMIGRDGTRAEVVAKFRKDFAIKIHDNIPFCIAVGKLRGKRLGCCCRADEECHGDVYLEWLNR